jgi:hypothetical protein
MGAGFSSGAFFDRAAQHGIVQQCAFKAGVDAAGQGPELETMAAAGPATMLRSIATTTSIFAMEKRFMRFT